MGGRIPLTLGGRLAGRAAAHLLPGLVVTGLAADVEVYELRVLNLTRDAERCAQNLPKRRTVLTGQFQLVGDHVNIMHGVDKRSVPTRRGGGSRAGRGGERTR